MPTIRLSLKLATCVTALAALAACHEGRRDGPIAISVIGEPQHIAEPLANSQTAPGAVILSATAQGLVSLDASGEVVPALAHSWIVVDSGQAYIFRLRRARWYDGSKVDAREVATLLRNRIKAASRMDPGGGLAAVTAVNAMTADVIEIDLTAPDPDFLTILAQSRLAIARHSGGTGPYRKVLENEVAILTPLPEMVQGPVDGNGTDVGRLDTGRTLRAERAALAVARFAAGENDLVLGGTFSDLPFVKAAKPSKRSLRFDPVAGLFGLAVVGHNPVLKQAEIRAALAMAIDRNAMVELFDIPNWQAQDVLVSGSGDVPSWRDTPIDQRRAQAAAIVARWKAQNPKLEASIRLRPVPGPGGRLLGAFLARQFKAIGLTLKLDDKSPDLELIDAVAPYDSPRWPLGQLGCARRPNCDPVADKLLEEAGMATDLDQRERLVDEAVRAYTRYGGFIPLASPVRWSLVGPRVTGFQPSRYGFHPLDQLVVPKR